MAEESADRSRHEEEAAAALVLLIRRAQRVVRKAARILTGHVLRAGGGTVEVGHAVRAGTCQGVALARQGARAGARRSWMAMTDLVAAPADLYVAGTDALRAQQAGDAIASQFYKSESVVVNGAAVDADEALDELLWRLDRTATTETVDAWNAEIQRQNDLAEALGLEITETWSAKLDFRTCKACRDLDGDYVVRPDRFEDAPPLHPNCRCFLLTEVRNKNQEAA